ncbi:MAG: AMP-binding protein [Eubacteriales bacterium]
MRKKSRNERRFTPVYSMRQYVANWEGHGDKIAFRYYTGNHQLTEMSYRTLTGMVRDMAAGFASLGLAGKRVAVVGETSPAWVTAYLATVAGGGVAIPMDKELPTEELLRFLVRAKADALVYPYAFHAKLADAYDTHQTVQFFIPMEGGPDLPAHPKVVPFDRVLALGAEQQGYDFPQTEDPNRLAQLLFTSGTTGTSKCVMLSEKNITSAVNAACGSVEFFPEDTLMSVLPIHHTYELTCGILAGMNYGMCVGINDSLKYVLKNFAVFRPTGMASVPLLVNTMYKKIWDEAAKKGKTGQLRFAIRLSQLLRLFGIDIRRKLFADIHAAFGGRLEKIVSGGAPLNPELVEKFEAFGIDVAEGYGITECSPLVAVNPYFAPKKGSVGPAVSCCTVKILDGAPNDKGFLEGEIAVKGDNVMLGYADDEAANAEVFTEDGYFRTGDVGYLDEDGYIYITGRKKSVIVLDNGKNVFPEELEEYLSQIEGIAEAVVLGRQQAGDEAVVLTAIVVPNTDSFAPGTPLADMEAKLKADIAAMNRKLVFHKQIRAVEIRTEPFEKTTSRKIKRHLVK